MEYRYRLIAQFRQAVNRCDLLGQDNIERAADWILSNDNWEKDYDLTDADVVDLETIRQWRQSVIASNN